jgi:hypothetical protein
MMSGETDFAEASCSLVAMPKSLKNFWNPLGALYS